MDNPKTPVGSVCVFCIYRESKITVTVEHVGAMWEIYNNLQMYRLGNDYNLSPTSNIDVCHDMIFNTSLCFSFIRLSINETRTSKV